MSKVIAVCIGNKSSINTDKLRLKFDNYQTGYSLSFVLGPPDRSGVMELAAYLVNQVRDAAVWMVVQGTLFDQQSAEEVQMLAQGASLPYVDYLFWQDRTAAGERGSKKTEPEELLAHRLVEMIARDMSTRH